MRFIIFKRIQQRYMLCNFLKLIVRCFVDIIYYALLLLGLQLFCKFSILLRGSFKWNYMWCRIDQLCWCLFWIQESTSKLYQFINCTLQSLTNIINIIVSRDTYDGFKTTECLQSK
jgi:hypothetical protein